MINHLFNKSGSRFLVLVLLLVTASCAKENNRNLSPATTDVLGGETSNPTSWWKGFGLFSNRAQMDSKSVVLVQFKNPPLLSSLQVDINGVKSVDLDLQASIETEQKNGIDNLKKLSGDISVMYRYRMVLNAVAIVVPNSVLDKVNSVEGVAFTEKESSFAQPETTLLSDSVPGAQAGLDLKSANSVKFIGADAVHKLRVKNRSGVDVALDGTGMKVGIIDSGIDYTHSMLGGPGTMAAFAAVDPSRPDNNFPTAKVVGGIDLVGSNYDSSSANLQRRVPVPDMNPMDEIGHGSHVAGTIAGIGDGVNTYDGVAPGAQLYAIKIFGSDGHSGDAVVLAGLEYAADPTGQMDPTQMLDAVNLSLGGTYGNPHLLYQQAIGNLTKAGTIVVAAAGNEGAFDYIVGAPSVSNDAFSIAASIDDSPQNWRFPTVKFFFNGGSLVSQAVASPSCPSVESGSLSGTILDVGIGDRPFADDVKAKLKGKVALMERGGNSFGDKFKMAQDAGAIGVIIANNESGDPFVMSTHDKYLIPAVMIAQSAGDAIKEKMKLGDVTVDFNPPDKVERKSVIDTIADFSSKGPRSFDSAIKPEISAPGQNIVSIAFGSGNKGVEMSGTSMSSPHVTGALTLLKELRPDLSVAELKSMVMGTAKILTDSKGNIYPVSIQGAGRIQLDKAVLAQAVTMPAALSLGEQNLSAKKTVRMNVVVKNISKTKLTFAPSFKARAKGIQMLPTSSLTLAPGDSGQLALSFVLDASSVDDPAQELDGFVTIKTGGALDLTLPVLAVVKKISSIKAQQLTTHASGPEDAPGAAVDLKLSNNGLNMGDVMVFNLLGLDVRKQNPQHSPYIDTSCNLQAAGYRIVTKNVDGQPTRMIQFVAKLFEPETTWNMCEISVLLDKDGKGVPSQELAGIAMGGVNGLLYSPGSPFSSVLFDADKMRDIRKQYELSSQVKSQTIPSENYQPSVIDENDMLAINHTTIAVIEAPIDELATTATGDISVRMATISDNVTVHSDDFLEKTASEWTRISLQATSQGYAGMPEKTTLRPGQSITLPLTKGYGVQDLLLVYPQNANVFSDSVEDGQGQILSTSFAP